MPQTTICQALKDRPVLISDGAWGTFLQRKGLESGACPELWCVEHPDVVRDIAASYLEAGSDMCETNSFGGSGLKLAEYGLEARTAELNEAAARCSREAAGEDCWVIASVGPTGKMLLMGDVSEEEMKDVFAEQITALAAGGADAICVETMSAIDEAQLAVQAAKESTDLEVIATFTFDRTQQDDYRTMMGVSPVEAAKAMLEAGADIVGTNCGNGIEQMIDIVREIRSGCDAPILVHANAGLPKLVNGENVFPETPEEMAKSAPALVEAGANIVGGCCGTTPAHIAALKAALSH